MMINIIVFIVIISMGLCKPMSDTFKSVDLNDDTENKSIKSRNLDQNLKPKDDHKNTVLLRHDMNCSAPPPPPSSKRYKREIIGGVMGKRYQWPWEATLMGDILGLTPGSVDACGGAILNNEWILTAAHCTYPAAEKYVEAYRHAKWTVKVGQYERDKTGPEVQERKVTQIIPHEQFKYNYTNRNFDNDISLIKVSPPLNLNFAVWPICLPPEGLEGRTPAGLICKIAGWPSDPKAKLVYHVIDVPIIERDDCIRSHANDTVTKNMICIKSTPEKDACDGSSGRVLMCPMGPFGRKLVASGILSWGPGKCGAAPGVYTVVSNYIQWIYTKMNQNNEHNHKTQFESEDSKF